MQLKLTLNGTTKLDGYVSSFRLKLHEDVIVIFALLFCLNAKTAGESPNFETEQ